MRFVEYIRREGYQLFCGAVDAQVYSYFDCANPRKAIWYYKRGSYQCVGCREQCETDSPIGFQMFLDLME
ncbi:MAG: DNA-binding protein [Desulfovibrionaceae bacterium]|nr:DNA-binding protein [Desulfovibrionaceae bacterium]MBF0515357.1 DNA-binding protein [Desulfovibrionaceae bacterium]